MPRRTAHAENSVQQALRAKRGGEWIASELLESDDPSDRQYSEDGLYIGSFRAKPSPDASPVCRFLTAALFVGVLLRLIGLVQYTGFSRVPGKSCFVKRVRTIRLVAKAGSKLALGFPIEYCLSLATIEDGHTNYAFEMISKLVSLHVHNPLEEDEDPVAFLREFISRNEHLPSCVTEEVRNTDADVSTSDLAEEFELVTPTIFERTEQPLDPAFEHAIETAKLVQQLVSCQVYDECDTDKIKIGHFPYYKRKNSTDMDYDLVELSAVKLVLQRFANINYYPDDVCTGCKKWKTWFTPVNLNLSGPIPEGDNIHDSVNGLIFSTFSMEEIINPTQFAPTRKRHKPEWNWMPPWFTGGHQDNPEREPRVLGLVGDTTIRSVKPLKPG